MNAKDNYINIDNARYDDQRQVMKKIAKNKECPFCPENLDKYHKQEIIRKGEHWILTRNQWPYKNTDVHLLAISKYHTEKLSDLKSGSFDELQGHIVWVESEFNVVSGGIAMRFGNITNNGATINHLHVHFIVPSPNNTSDEKVRFKIG